MSSSGLGHVEDVVENDVAARNSSFRHIATTNREEFRKTLKRFYIAGGSRLAFVDIDVSWVARAKRASRVKYFDVDFDVFIMLINQDHVHRTTWMASIWAATALETQSQTGWTWRYEYAFQHGERGGFLRNMWSGYQNRVQHFVNIKTRPFSNQEIQQIQILIQQNTSYTQHHQRKVANKNSIPPRWIQVNSLLDFQVFSAIWKTPFSKKQRL